MKNYIKPFIEEEEIELEDIIATSGDINIFDDDGDTLFDKGTEA